VHSLDGHTLTVAFVNAGSRESFARNGCDEVLRQVLIDVLGVDWRVESIVDPSATAASAASPATGPAGPTSEPPDQERGPARQPVDARAASATAAPATAMSATSTSSTAEAPPAATATPDGAHVDDPDAEVDGDTHELLTRELGAQVIEEIPHQP